MLKYSNRVNNYQHYQSKVIRTAVQSLSPERKAKLLDEINLRKGVSNLTGENYDHQNFDLVEKLLETREEGATNQIIS